MQTHFWSSLLIATTNAGKVQEIRRVLDGLPVRLLTLSDVPAPPEPAETGATFADNALIKARAYAYATRLPTVAEDSGLAIDALGGRPGIHSARYPGESYVEKFDNLYRELAPHPEPWTARFVCALAFIAPDAAPDSDDRAADFACEGVVHGEITRDPRGTNGFGYDPIFFHPPSGRTTGELTVAEKLALSHRGAAFRTFRTWAEEGWKAASGR